MHRIVGVVALIVTSIVTAVPAAAQTIGVFRWQLVPYCNVVSLAISQTGNVFRVDGTDDQCGAGTQASVTGDAYFNPNGTVGFGFTVVSSPGASPVHVTATITLPALNGSWRDSSGNSGTFVPTPGAGIGGSPRPNLTREVSVDVFNALPIGTTTLANGGCRSFNTASSSSLLVGLALPLGAVITQVRVKFFDGSIASAATAVLAADDSPALTSDLASDLLVSSAGPTITPLVLTALAAGPVSDTRTYHLVVTAPGHVGELQFCGASVRYAMP